MSIEHLGREPPLSIVTICFENPSELRKTVHSVLSKRVSSEVEIIVVDGSNSLRCEEVVKKIPQKLIYLHEPDDGIYDAMNKGLNLASGKHLLFLNSGDELSQNLDLAGLMRHLEASEGEVVYGDIILTLGEQEFLKRSPPSIGDAAQCAKVGDLPSHQATFYPQKFYTRYSFNDQFTVSGDTEYSVRAFSKLPSKRIDFVIAKFALGGLSNRPGSFREVIAHWREYCASRQLGPLGAAIALPRFLLKPIAIGILGFERYYRFRLSQRHEVSGQNE